MQDRIDEPQLHEARTLIENIRHGAAVESSSERLLEMIAELIEAQKAAGAPGAEVAASYQKSLG